jgi:hypothetical protein
MLTLFYHCSVNRFPAQIPLTIWSLAQMSRVAAPGTVGITVAALTGGMATPLLIEAGASGTFATIGSGLIAGGAGDLATQTTQIGTGQRKSISGQEVATSALAGAAINGALAGIGKAASALGKLPQEPVPPTENVPAGNSPEATPLGTPKNPITASPGQTQTVDPKSLLAGQRATLVQGRLDVQAKLQQQNIPRNGGPPVVYQNGVLYDGHHAVRAAADRGATITVKVMPGSGSSVTGKPVTELPVH